MSSILERKDSSDDEPILEGFHIECFVSIRKLTDEDIKKYTNDESSQVNGLNTVATDHNYSASSSPVECDSDATTVEDDSTNTGGNNLSIQLGHYADDEVYSFEINRNTKRKVPNSDKCAIPEKLIIKYAQMKKRSSSTLPIFCLFCLKEYTNVTLALYCHYRQTKHFPYRCVECEEVTLNTKDMLLHYLKSHPTLTSVRYRRTFAPNKERWIHKFIIYQLKCVTNQAEMMPNAILHKYCPVCNQYDYKISEKNTKNKPQHKLYSVLDKNHIHKHLKYNPFQCKLCLEQGTRFDLSIVNRKARQHLMNKHNLTEPSENDLKDHFPASGMIPELERYINSYVKYIQESFDSRKEGDISPIPSAATTKSSTTKRQLTSTPSPSSSAPVIKQSSPLSINSPTGKRGKTSKSLVKTTPKSTGKKKKLSESYTIDDMYYPDPKYSRKDSKGFRKNNNSKPFSYGSRKNDDFNNSVIDLDSYFEEVVSTPYSKQEQTPKIICFFCNNMQSNMLVAWDHYAIHLNYRPITCQLCQKCFPGPKAFQLHGADHVEHDSLPYKWNHDEVIEAWISSFVNSFTTQDEIIAKPEFACCCPICCKKFLHSQQQLNLNTQKLSYEDIRRHIYAHLRYQPFQCNICPPVDSVFVSDLEVDGARHLTFHQIVSPKEAELSKHFTKSRGIDALDTFLVDHFAKIRRLFNMPETTSGDTNLVPCDPVCDVALLFSSIQETLGNNTLNNILDKVSLNVDQQPTASNHVSSSTSETTLPIENPCTPSSTTSDSVDFTTS